MQPYSFEDTVGQISNPNSGLTPFLLYGQLGVGELIIRMASERTAQDVAADGNVMQSYIRARNGAIEIQCQQVSVVHRFLLTLYNILEQAANAGDITGWMNTSVTVQNQVDGSTHVLTGVSFSKIPDKPYAAQGQRITWSLMAADVDNTIPMPN
jgi:hypothetical protein